MLPKLHRFLNLARRIVPSKATLPVLESVCVKGNRLIVTDLEHMLVMNCNLPGFFLIPFKILKKIISFKPVSLILSKGCIEYDKKKLSFETSTEDDFPSLPDEKFEHTTDWDPELIRVIHTQKKFVSKDVLKPVLNHIQVKRADEFVCSSTNGHLLRRISILNDDSVDTYELLITTKSLNILRQLKRPVKIFSSDKWIKFNSEEFTLYQRKCHEKYPDTDTVIPTAFTGSVTVLNPMLQLLVESGLPFTMKKTQIGILSVSDKKIRINCEDPDQSTHWEGDIPVENRHGEDIQMSLNLKYLDSVLNGIDAKRVTLKYSSPNTALVVVPNEKEDFDEICLVMPVRMEDKHGK